MSTTSPPSATTTSTTKNGTKSSSKKTPSPMLNKYLATPRTTTENLAFPGPSRGSKKVVAERRTKTKEFLSDWQAEWEKME